MITLERGESRAEILLRAGGTVGSLRLAGEDVLAAPSIEEVEREFAFRFSLDTFASNLFLTSGFAVPLFPVVGHLPARPLGLDLGEAEIQGRRLPVPLNLNRQHWHGLAYLKRAEILIQEPTRAHLRLPAGFFGPYWTGQVQLDLLYELGEDLRVQMKATNIGPTPSPVTAGVRLNLRGEAKKSMDGVRVGLYLVTGDPLAHVDTDGAITLGSELIWLEPDASFTFTWRVTKA